MTVMTTQPPLPLIPTGATEIGAAAAMIEDEHGGRVFVHGHLAFAWDAGDTAGRRFAAVSLMRIKAATQVQVAAAFDTSPLTLWRWAQALSAAGVSALVPHRKGPRRRLQTHPRGDRHHRGAARAGPVAAGDRRAGRGLGGQRPQSTVRHRHRADTETDTDDPTTVSDETEARDRDRDRNRFRATVDTEAEIEAEAEAEPEVGPSRWPSRSWDRCRGVRCRCWPIRSIAPPSGRWRRSG